MGKEISKPVVRYFIKNKSKRKKKYHKKLAIKQIYYLQK